MANLTALKKKRVKPIYQGLKGTTYLKKTLKKELG